MSYADLMRECFDGGKPFAVGMKQAADVMVAMATDYERTINQALVDKKGLNELRDEATEIAVAHGFKDATVGEDLMLIVTELAEAMEDHRQGYSPSQHWYESKEGGKATSRIREYQKPCGIPIEIADMMIRCLHFCGKHGIDIDKAVREKMAYNRSRPMMHGKVI